MVNLLPPHQKLEVLLVFFYELLVFFFLAIRRVWHQCSGTIGRDAQQSRFQGPPPSEGTRRRYVRRHELCQSRVLWLVRPENYVLARLSTQRLRFNCVQDADD